MTENLQFACPRCSQPVEPVYTPPSGGPVFPANVVISRGADA